MMGLFLDTSSKYLTIAITRDDVVVDFYREKLDCDISRVTTSKIDELLKKAGINPKDISKIYCVNGPGSFTGIRVGVTIAKVYAWMMNINVIPVSSLYFMASGVKDYDYIVPMIDARRGYVYSSIYDKNYNVILEEQYIKLDELVDKVKLLDGSYLMVSNDNIKNIDVTYQEPDINNMLKYLKKEEVNPHLFAPNYLKKTEAEENLNND